MIAAIDRFTIWVGRATAWLALAIVLLMATNVVLRYLFSYGSVWSQELEWHLLVPLIMFSVAYAYQQGEHVRVDVLVARDSPRTQAMVNRAAAAKPCVQQMPSWLTSWARFSKTSSRAIIQKPCS